MQKSGIWFHAGEKRRVTISRTKRNRCRTNLGREWRYQWTFQEPHTTKRWTTKKKETWWSAHDSHTSVNVYIHEVKLYLLRNGYLWICVCVLYFTVSLCICSLYSIYICVFHCTALRTLMMHCLKRSKVFVLNAFLQYCTSTSTKPRK